MAVSTLRRRESERVRQARRRDKLRSQVANIFPPDQCQRCHRYDMPTELAHTSPTRLNGRSRGTTEVLKDVLANVDSYARLCIDCHRGFDRGEIGLELEPAPF